MAGEYEVLFNFRETSGYTKDYDKNSNEEVDAKPPRAKEVREALVRFVTPKSVS